MGETTGAVLKSATGEVREIAARRRPFLGWRIWYGDGSTTCSSETTWEECPDDDVQVVWISERAPARSTAEVYRTGYNGDDEYRIPTSTRVKRGKWFAGVACVCAKCKTCRGFTALFKRAFADESV